jgi:hypothetical protein
VEVEGVGGARGKGEGVTSVLARAIAHRLYTSPICRTSSHDRYGDFIWSCPEHRMNPHPEEAVAKIVDQVLTTYVESRPDMVMVGETPVTLAPARKENE